MSLSTFSTFTREPLNQSEAVLCTKENKPYRLVAEFVLQKRNQ